MANTSRFNDSRYNAGGVVFFVGSAGVVLGHPSMSAGGYRQIGHFSYGFVAYVVSHKPVTSYVVSGVHQTAYIVTET
jgi:hypothetical protein